MRTEPTSGNRDLLVLLARRCPGLSVYSVCDKVAALHRLAGRWQRATIHWCNGTKDEAWVDRERGAVKEKIEPVLYNTGLRVNLTGDPRGYTLKLISTTESEFPGNTMGGREEGWGVE